MSQFVRGFAIASTVVCGLGVVRAQDTPTTQPARHAGAHLLKPYGDIPDLTDDQKAGIAAIHKKALEDAHAILIKEDQDIRALLTDDQKAELDQLIADKRVKAKEKKEKQAATAPATQP